MKAGTVMLLSPTTGIHFEPGEIRQEARSGQHVVFTMSTLYQPVHRETEGHPWEPCEWKDLGRPEIKPLCPDCKAQLDARDLGRRFMEDHHYVECRNGHLWRLVEPDPPAPPRDPGKATS